LNPGRASPNANVLSNYSAKGEATSPPKAQIEIVFASACRNNAGGIQSLTLFLEDKETATFLNEMENQGVNVKGIRKRFDLLDTMKRLAEKGSK